VTRQVTTTSGNARQSTTRSHTAIPPTCGNPIQPDAIGRGPLTPTGIYQIIARRGRQCGVTAYPHRFRHHFSHTWLDRGGAERDLMELNGWTSPQMLTRYGASARAARARRSYDRIMDDST
jgi:integrase